MAIAAACNIIKNSCDIALRQRTVSNTATRGLDLDHRIQPIKPARAGARHSQRKLATRGFRLQRGGDLFRSDRERAGIAWNKI